MPLKPSMQTEQSLYNPLLFICSTMKTQSFLLKVMPAPMMIYHVPRDSSKLPLQKSKKAVLKWPLHNKQALKIQLFL